MHATRSELNDASKTWPIVSSVTPSVRSNLLCSAIFSSDNIVLFQMLTEAAGVSVGAEVLAEVATGVSEAVGVLVGEL